MNSNKNSLVNSPPTVQEFGALHNLLIHPDKAALKIGDTKLGWTKVCHPQVRNIHNKVFGGYLMKEAFELAYACGRIFSRARPLLLAQDLVQFVKPVEIGSILNLNAKVVRSQGSPHRTFQVSVEASVMDPVTGHSDVTNVFHFIFYTESMPVRNVIPQTYLEATEYLMAARRQESSLSFERVSSGQRWLIDPEQHGY